MFASDIAFTPTVKEIQQRLGSREAYARMESGRGWETEITEQLSAFLAERDMFYLATANAAGQPYVQYRGGPKGLLQPIDQKTIGFGDFAGNQQFISLGNLADNPKASIFLMDYENRRRIKIWGEARVVEGDRELIQRLHHPEYGRDIDRAILIDVHAWDVNCPQHIHQRVRVDELPPKWDELIKKVDTLESENRQLRKKLEALE